jgi:hypothetical protein
MGATAEHPAVQGTAGGPLLDTQWILGRFPQALSQINQQARAAGLLGWPGLTEFGDGNAPSGQILAEAVLRNDRALLFTRQGADSLTALVLMARVHPVGEDAWALVLIRNIPDAPLVALPTAPDLTGRDTDRILWSNQDATHRGDAEDLKTWPQPGVRVLPDQPTDFAVASPETDAFEWHLYAPGKPVALIIDDLTDDQDRAENKADQQTEGYGSFLRRSSFQTRRNIIEADHRVWFEAEGKSYVVDKADWDLWLKGPHPSEAP